MGCILLSVYRLFVEELRSPLLVFSYLLFISVTLYVVPFTLVYAAPIQKGLEVNPAYTEVVLDTPNQEKTVEIKYTNNTDQPLTLNLSPKDFRQNEEGSTYSFVNDSKNYSYSLSSFLSLESDQIEILPHQSKVFKVKIKNREDISPGGHYAALIAKFTIDENKSPNTVIPALTSLVLLRKVGGEQFRLILQNVSFPNVPLVINEPERIYLTFRNDGNIHLVPYGRVEITDQFGRLIKKGVINEDSKIVFPESRRDIVARMQDITFELPLSWNSVRVSGNDSLKKVGYTYKKSYLYINPVPLFIMILAISIFLWLIKKRRLSRIEKD